MDELGRLVPLSSSNATVSNLGPKPSSSQRSPLVTSARQTSPVKKSNILECRVCEDTFQLHGDKIPRLLFCGHTLCHACLLRSDQSTILIKLREHIFECTANRKSIVYFGSSSLLLLSRDSVCHWSSSIITNCHQLSSWVPTKGYLKFVRSNNVRGCKITKIEPWNFFALPPWKILIKVVAHLFDQIWHQ